MQRRRCREQRETLQGSSIECCKGTGHRFAVRDISPLAMRYICFANAIYASMDACDMSPYGDEMALRARILRKGLALCSG